MSQTAVPSRAARHQQKQLPLPDPRSFFQRPPRGRRPQRPYQTPQRPPLWRRVLRYWWAWLLPIVGLGLGGVFGLIYVFGQVPVPQQVLEAQATVVFDAAGNQIGTLAEQENRRIVPLSEVSDHMENAVLAAEDHQFYEHGAVSYRGILRAAWANVTNGSVTQGGSTLTQQYVKIAYLTQERTLLRKVNEAILAIKLEQQHSKERILEDYLNIIYFGRGAYGVEAAAQAYFNVSAAKLNPQQAAFLAGIIRNPNFYAEEENAEAGKERRNTVLATMGELGMLPPGESGQWQQRNLDLKQPKSIGVASSNAPHFMEKVRLSLIEELGAERVNRGGLRVETTLDPQLQEQARVAVEGTLEEEGENTPRAALTAIEPDTGAVVAMYGGRDFVTRQFNYATDAPRQAGSTMKPFVLATALENNIGINSRFDGSRCIRGLDEDESRELCNFNDANYGMISLLDATIKSANTPFLRLIQEVEPEAVAQTANTCGFDSTLTQTGERPANLPAVPSLALGAGEVSTLQLTSGFAAIANGGVHIDPFVISQVLDAEGNVVFQHRETVDSQVRCMEEETANLVSYALQQAVEDGTGHDAAIGIPAAGKTGTTNNNVDARFAGYTPQLAASVWLGYDDASRELENIQGIERVTGGSLPAGIWHDFMAGAIDQGRLTEVAFEEPDLELGETLNPPPPPQEQDENGQPADDDGEDGDQGDGEGEDGEDNGDDGDGQDGEGDGGDQGQDEGGDGQDGGGENQDDDGGDGGDQGGDDQAQAEGEGGDAQPTAGEDGGDGNQAAPQDQPATPGQ